MTKQKMTKQGNDNFPRRRESKRRKLRKLKMPKQKESNSQKKNGSLKKRGVKKRRRREIRERILVASKGVLRGLDEFLLFQVAFFFNLLGSTPTSRGAWQAYSETLADLAEFKEDEEGLNLYPLKRAFYRLKSKGLVALLKEELVVKPKITTAGRKRLAAVLPFYDEERTWDGRVYIVTYDVPEDQRSDRELLREYLKRLGAGQLQLSVFVTPYNPKEALRDFLEEKKLKARVIVSDLGEDGNIGDKDLKDLLVEVYHLKDLNKRYLEFIRRWDGVADLDLGERNEAIFSFLSILGDDSQLPFKFLPKGWQGVKAYQVFKEIVGMGR